MNLISRQDFSEKGLLEPCSFKYISMGNPLCLEASRGQCPCHSGKASVMWRMLGNAPLQRGTKGSLGPELSAVRAGGKGDFGPVLFLKDGVALFSEAPGFCL